MFLYQYLNNKEKIQIILVFILNKFISQFKCNKIIINLNLFFLVIKMKDYKIQCFNPVSPKNDCKCKGITLIPPKTLPPNCLISVIINSFDELIIKSDCKIDVKNCINTKEGYVPMYYIVSKGLKPILINCLDKKYKYTMDIIVQIPVELDEIGGICDYKVKYFQQIIINDKACNKTYYLDPKETYCFECEEGGSVINIEQKFLEWVKLYKLFINDSAILSLAFDLLNKKPNKVECVGFDNNTNTNNNNT